MKIIIVSLFVLVTLLGCRHSEEKIGNEIIDQIESYQTKNGRLPDDLSQIGIKETEEGPIYYEKKTATTYKLWYGTTVGESVTYDSDTKSWR